MMKGWLVVVLGVFAGSCTTTAPVSLDAAVFDAPPPLPALPPPKAVETEQFASSTFCAQCHLRGDGGSTAMSNAAGDDVSPLKMWRGSMMALAARDPFYLAVFEKEIEANPDEKETIEAICTRCHAPAGVIASERDEPKISFHELTGGTSTNAAIGREGITCSFCHQIRDSDLGRDSSFSGGFSVDFSRKMYGPHANPDTDPMEMFIRYTPVYSEHIQTSALCATCHTVIVPGVDGQEVVEQAPYLEWLNSSYNLEEGAALGTSCQGCHMPRTNEDGTPIATAIAKFPEGLNPRGRYSQHTLIGGNSFMLRLMATYSDWVGSNIADEELLANAELSEEHLRKAASLEVVDATVQGDEAVVSVRIDNLAGHKLPTGYPTRRAWLHVTARDLAGTIVFESGGYDADGRITTRANSDAVAEAHANEITEGQVQIYEQVLVDADGLPTLQALNVSAVLKDNRILPKGWSDTHEQIARIRPIGVEGDDNFGAGADTVRYRFSAGGNSQLEVEVELLYQSVPPAAIDATAAFRTAASERFVDMATQIDNRPIRMAETTLLF
jgi:cytochrome c553